MSGSVKNADIDIKKQHSKDLSNSNFIKWLNAALQINETIR